MKKVLILGGTGFVGQALCEQLSRRHAGGRIIVPTRRLGHGRTVQVHPTVVIERADVHDEATLTRLVSGCDAVVNLVAILHGKSAAFDQVHVQLPRRLAAACKAAGVRRVIHVSAIGVGPDAPSNYLLSKAAGEAELREAGLDLTLLRPSVIFGAKDRFMNLFASMQAVLPLVPLAGASARFQPVWVEDVARGITEALDRPDSIGQIIECAGPQTYTLAQLVRLAGHWSGHERTVLPLPDFVGRIQAGLMALLPGEPLMSADNLDSMRIDSVAGDNLPGLDALGIEVSSLEAVVPGYLAPSRGCARLNPWRAHARR